MTAKNVPTAGDTTVPSALAERRRMFRDDVSGTSIYFVLVAVVALATIAIAAWA